MLTLRTTTADAIEPLRADYVADLAAPLDGMWESFVGLAASWGIYDEGECVGYACVNDGRRLLQFHVATRHERKVDEAFALAVRETGARGAIVSTFEPWLAPCLDVQRELRVHSLLYHSSSPPPEPAAPREPTAAVELELVAESERAEVEAFLRTCFEQDPGAWLTGYLERLVARGELFALRESAALVGTGELRVSDSQPPYADLGVVVSPEHRGRGVATQILRELVARCAGRSRTPICSTTIDNVGARRAIAKAGFLARHRLLEIGF